MILIYVDLPHLVHQKYTKYKKQATIATIVAPHLFHAVWIKSDSYINFTKRMGMLFAISHAHSQRQSEHSVA